MELPFVQDSKFRAMMIDMALRHNSSNEQPEKRHFNNRKLPSKGENDFPHEKLPTMQFGRKESQLIKGIIGKFLKAYSLEDLFFHKQELSWFLLGFLLLTKSHEKGYLLHNFVLCKD